MASREHDWSYADGIADIAQAVEAARAQDPDRPVIVFGHSIGAQLAAGHELHQDPCDGFVGVGAAIPWHRNYSHRGIGLMIMAMSVPLVTRVWGYVPRPLFGGPGARTLMNEWGRFIRTGHPPYRAERPHSTPSLIVHLQGDSFAPTKANKAFIDKFTEPARTTRWVYPKNAAPDGGTNDHVEWVRTPGPVVDQVVAWWATARSVV